MSKFAPFVTSLTLLLGAHFAATGYAAEPISLFNGKDLTGWVPMYGGQWDVEHGVIVGRNGAGWTTNPTKSGSWLRTEKSYGDFVLELEYAINEGGNSGIFLRSALEKNPAFSGHEMQILDDHGRTPETWTSGALYDVVAPTRNMSKPAGEWNQIKVQTQGRRVQVWMNGEQIVDYESDRLQRGYLGLQVHDETSVVKFRNLRLTETSPPATIRVGIIGLDTSHAPAFAKLLNDANAPPELSNCRVVAAYPQGSPDIESSVSRVPKYTAQLQEMGVEIVSSIEKLLSRVDAVLLETNDGRPHLQQVRPVLAAGKPVFIDKPLAGSLKDVIAIMQEAEAAQVPIFSSSSLRYVPGAQAIRHGSIGMVLGCSAYSPCALEATHPDLYWYGIHGVEMLFTVMGPGCQSVVRVAAPDMDVVVGTWQDGRIGTFRGLRSGKRGYGGVAFGEQEIREIGDYVGYRPLVVEIVNFFRTGKPPVDARETLEIYAFMEAADESKRLGGVPVKLDDLISATE